MEEWKDEYENTLSMASELDSQAVYQKLCQLVEAKLKELTKE